MKSLIVYGSRHGNTEKIARAIAAELGKHGEAAALSIEEATARSPIDTDLLVIGGPTEAHGVTPPMKAYVESLTTKEVKGRAAASFDTRLNGARWLTGAAGEGIARRLKARGARLIAQPESFLVAGKEPVLIEGEMDRATVWAAELAALVERRVPVGA